MNLPNQGSKIPQNLLFNKSAIARLMRIPPSYVIDFQINPNGDVLAATKSGPVLFTQKQMEDEFHRYRMESGSDLEAYHAGQGHFGDRWDVRGSKGDIYQVEIVGDEYRCTCEDWHQHQTRCKHGWAVYFHEIADKTLSCHDCGHWTTNNGGHCKLRAQNDLEQLPITHAETCHFLIIGFEEF